MVPGPVRRPAGGPAPVAPDVLEDDPVDLGVEPIDHGVNYVVVANIAAELNNWIQKEADEGRVYNG